MPPNLRLNSRWDFTARVPAVQFSRRAQVVFGESAGLTIWQDLFIYLLWISGV